MSSPTLGPPPRQLGIAVKRSLWLGNPVLTLSLVTTGLILLSVLMLFLIYGVGFSSLLQSRGAQIQVEGEISRLDSEFLPSGGKVQAAVAPVKVNDVTIEAKGYGPKTESAKVGQTVQIIIPKDSPQDAWLSGFWPKATSPSLLLLFGLLFAVPALVGLLITAWTARRGSRLLRQGEIHQGKRIKAIGLPRPLKDHRLVRYEYQLESAKSRRFWSLQKADDEDHTLLVRADDGAALVNRIVPELSLCDEALTGGDRFTKIRVYVNSTVLALHVLLLLAFLIT